VIFLLLPSILTLDISKKIWIHRGANRVSLSFFLFGQVMTDGLANLFGIWYVDLLCLNQMVSKYKVQLLFIKAGRMTFLFKKAQNIKRLFNNKPTT
jgi:hypothetical protein